MGDEITSNDVADIHIEIHDKQLNGGSDINKEEEDNINNLENNLTEAINNGSGVCLKPSEGITNVIGRDSDISETITNGTTECFDTNETTANGTCGYLKSTETITNCISGSVDLKEQNREPLIAVTGSVTKRVADCNEDRVSLHNGPDEVIPTDRLTTWNANEAVRLRMTPEGKGSVVPISMMTALRATVDKVPDQIALAQKKDGTWKTISYKEYQEMVRLAARAFIMLGLQPRSGVGLIGFNAPEWHIAQLGAIFAGGIATGIYSTNSAEACFYVLHDAHCEIVVVENDMQLAKILEIRHRLPALKAIIQYTGTLSTDLPSVYTWDQLMKFGEGIDLEVKLEERIRAQAPNMCCLLIYTSGTVGSPKGVMLSHDNITWTATATVEHLEIPFGESIIVSYLPLSHGAAQMVDIAMPIICGASVYFAKPDALKGSLRETLREVRPTMFLGVPRVWEKMQEGMIEVGKSNGPVVRAIASWAKGVGLTGSLAKMKKQSPSFAFSLADKIMFSKVRRALGFDRCTLFVCGAAPICRSTLEYFYSINIPIMEWYGMTESSGPHTGSRATDFRISSCGKEFYGAETFFDKTVIKDTEDNVSGEICMGGRHVFMGYLNMEDKTKEAVDENGWLHSGDIGKRDEDGFVSITGRIKELIITAGGENVAPVPIEHKVLEVLPCVSNCMLIGDQRKFLALLITLKTEVNPETMEPLDTLSPASIQWCRRVGSAAMKVSEIITEHDVAVMSAIEEGVTKVNKASISRAQCIQKWSILPRDFSVTGGELGPTLKLKRPVVVEMYKKEIEQFYAGSKDQ